MPPNRPPAIRPDALRTRREARPTRRFSDDATDIAAWARDYMRRSASLDPRDARDSDMVPDMITGANPFVGVPQAMRDFERSRREDSKFGMAVNGVGVGLAALPFVGGSVRGGLKAGSRAAREALPKLSKSQLVRRVMQLIEDNPSGVTINPRTGRAFNEGGFVVSNPPGARQVVTEGGEGLSEAQARQFLQQNRGIMQSNPEYKGGWWRSDDTGKGYLDANQVLLNENSALLAASQRNEEAIFDLNTFNTVNNPDFNPAFPNAARQVEMPQPKMRGRGQQQGGPSVFGDSVVTRAVDLGARALPESMSPFTVKPGTSATLGTVKETTDPVTRRIVPGAQVVGKAPNKKGNLVNVKGEPPITRFSRQEVSQRTGQLLRSLEQSRRERPSLMQPGWNEDPFTGPLRGLIKRDPAIENMSFPPFEGELGVVPEALAESFTPESRELMQALAHNPVDDGGPTWYPSSAALPAIAKKLGLTGRDGDRFNLLRVDASAQTPVPNEIAKATLVNYMQKRGFPMNQEGMWAAQEQLARETGAQSFTTRMTPKGPRPAKYMMPDALMGRMTKNAERAVENPMDPEYIQQFIDKATNSRTKAERDFYIAKVRQYEGLGRFGNVGPMFPADTRHVQGQRLGSNLPFASGMSAALSNPSYITPNAKWYRQNVSGPLGISSGEAMATGWNELARLLPGTKTGGGDFLHQLGNTITDGMHQQGMQVNPETFQQSLRDMLLGDFVVPPTVSVASSAKNGVLSKQWSKKKKR